MRPHWMLCELGVVLMELDAPLYVIRRHQGLPEVYGASQTAVDAARDYFVRQTGVVETWLASGNSPKPLADHLEIVSSRDDFRSAFERNFPPEALATLAQNART